MAKEHAKIRANPADPAAAALKAIQQINTDRVNMPEEYLQEWAKSGMQNSIVHNPEFSGVARSAVCFDNQGNRNFKILTLYIEQGKVVRMDLSDAYAQFEAIFKLDLWSDRALTHLNNNWFDGKTLSK